MREFALYSSPRFVAGHWRIYQGNVKVRGLGAHTFRLQLQSSHGTAPAVGLSALPTLALPAEQINEEQTNSDVKRDFLYWDLQEIMCENSKNTLKHPHSAPECSVYLAGYPR